jgi:hypothetical protein
MEDNIKSISTDLFYKVRSRFSGLKLGSETGEVTMNPEEAAFFDFDYMENGNPLGHVSISIAEPGNMKVYYSTDITETMDDGQKLGWYEFLKGLREFAKRRLMSFDTRDISKDNLDKRDFAFLTQNSNSGIGESVMKEGMYGSSKTSYQKLENTTLIIKHNKQVDETQPGSRARNILGLFIENSQGERFKYPFIHLAGARAMQRHVQEGGLPYDDVGRYIISMSEQIAQLKNFGNYVVRNDLMNSETNDIVERSSSALNRLREEIKRLSKRNYYQQFKEQFTTTPQEEIPQDVIEDLTNKFTVRNFKEDIKDVFPVIYKLMKEAEASNELGYDDIVEMTSTIANEDAEIDLSPELEDPFEQFEAWAYSLGEDGGISSQDEQEQQAAVKSLQALVGQHFPAGPDGTNAIESLKGIIDDPALDKAIKQAAMKDSDTCVRPLIYKWLQSNAPEVLDSLDFGDMDSAKESNDESEQTERPVGMREVAEFISSFYDKESGTFPKGPEGVAIMVGKKFGEQAEAIARKFVERMAPQQSTNHNPELAELARIGDLAGVSEGPMWDKIKAMGGKARDAVSNITDYDAEGMHRQNFEKWIDKQEGLTQHKEELLQYFDDEIESGTESDQAGRKALDMLKRNAHSKGRRMSEEAPFGTYYYEKLAQEVFDMDPNLDTSGRADDVLNAAFPLIVRDLGSKKRANNLLNYDADFPSDFVSAYADLKRAGKSNNQPASEEIDRIKKLSGISQGMGF